MVEVLRNEYRPDSVTPPGEILAEILEDRGMTQAELAQRTGRPRKTISEIVNAKAAITPDTAIQLERALGIKASFWGKLEANYRDYLARDEERERLADQVGWVQEFPVNEMVREGWLTGWPSDPIQQVRELLGFFGVANPAQWRQRNAALQASFRQSATFEIDQNAVAVWLRMGEKLAQEVHCESYNKERFLEALLEARNLTNQRPEEFVPKLSEICAAAGVAVVFVPQMPKSRVSGVARWLSPEKALVQLSLRYRKNDYLWFTFFHEAAHILLHAKRTVFLEADKSDDDEDREREANEFAANWLIPPAQFKAIRSAAVAASGRISKMVVLSWARSVGIAPGIVVGRLQHEGLLPYQKLNGLKVTLEWAK